RAIHGRKHAESHAVGAVEHGRLHRTRRIADRRIQLRRGNAYQPANRVQPHRLVVVFHDPVHRVARQSVPAAQCDDPSTLDMAEASLHCDPERTAPVEPEVVDAAFRQTVNGCVRCPDLTVLDVRHVTLEPKPQATLLRIRQQSRHRVADFQFVPRNLFHYSLAAQAIEAARFVGNPEIPRAVSADRRRSSRGEADRNEPTVLEVRHPAQRGDPESPALVLEECSYAVVWKPAIEYLASSSTPCLAPHSCCRTVACRAKNRDASAIPSAQAAKSAEPHAAIPRRENGPRRCTRQALIGGNRSDGEIAKDVEAVLRRDPDVSFTIFKNPRDEVAGQAVRLRVHISAALVYMQEAAVQGPDPQTAIAVLQQPFWFEPGPSAWKWIGNALPLNELPDSVLGNDQQFAVVVLIQRLRIADRGVRHRVMRRRARPPSPQPGLSRCPECAAAVLVQRSHPLAETAALALYVATLDRAQPPGRTCVPAGPYRSFVIHKERIDAVASELRILGQPAVHPTGKTFQRADPDSPIARGEQTSNPPVGELFISGRVPGHTPNAVEAQHAEFRPQPQITIGRLRNGSDLPLCKAFAEGPCRVRVLVEVESDIQRVRTWAAHEGNDQRDHPLRESRPFECVGPRHDGSC